MHIQTLASKLISDAKSKMTDEFQDMVFEALVSEYFSSIADTTGGN